MTAPIFCARLSRVALFVLLCSAIGLANASDDHDHGNETPIAAGAASPRLQAHSDLFELVGVLDHGQLTVYLDRYDTNEPVLGAKIEYEAGNNKGLAQQQADGTYLVKFADLAKPGQHAFSFTVSAGSQTDLLAGELDTHEDHHDEAETGSWLRWAGYVAAALVLAAAAFAFLRRRLATRRATHVG